jgi:peptidoglycan/LPS O-acetylase OafA/YrhL
MKDRYSYIDSTRGVAAIVVLLHHFIYFYGLYPGLSYTSGPFTYILDGSSAVTYFFVLSGFVLSVKFFDGQKEIDKIDFRNFVIQRIFRIYPLFIVCLFISFFCLKYFIQLKIDTYPSVTSYADSLWQENKSISDVLKEAILVFRIPAHSRLRLLPQDWTLIIEIIVSLFVPVLVLVLKRSVAWFGFLTVLIFYYEINVVPFSMGVILARYYSSLRVFFAPQGTILKCSFVLLAMFFFTNALQLLEVFAGGKAVPLISKSTGSAMLLGIIICSGTLQKKLVHPVLVFLGKISYGLYLSHFFILIFFLPYFLKFLNQHDVTGEITTRVFSLTFLITVTLIVSYILHCLVEKPFVFLGKRITTMLERSPGFSFAESSLRTCRQYLEVKRGLKRKEA